MKILITIFFTVVVFICPGKSFAQLTGSSLRLSADTNYITIADALDKSIHDTVTWEFWIYNRCESDAVVFPITKGWCDTDWSYYIALQSDSGQLIFSKFEHGQTKCNNQPFAEYRSKTGVARHNTWTHVALVMIDSSAQFYVNGLPVNTSLFAGKTFSGLRGSAEPVLIGAYHTATINNNTYLGVPKANIDEVRIWHVARTPIDILNNYKSLLTGNETGLVAYYRLNETGSGAGITVVNSAANSLIPDGTTMGSKLSLEFENNNIIVNRSPACSVPLKKYFRDSDRDGYGNSGMDTLAVMPPPGYVADSTDCNDDDMLIHPGAVEICGNGIDEDCDGSDGVCAGALHFDGSDDRVAIGNYPAFNTPHLSVQAWVKPDHIDGWPWRCVVTKRNCCGPHLEQWTMQTEGNGLMHFHGETDSVGFFLTDTLKMVVGKWVQFTFTYDGHTAILYRDGKPEIIDTACEGNILTESWPVVIGDRDAGLDWFPGVIDEVRIWDRALTPEEILANMNCHLTGKEPGLVAYYDFNQGVADQDNSSVKVLQDRGPNGLNGQLQHMALSGKTSNWVASPFTDRPVSITRQPSDVNVTEGDDALFVTASPDSAANFQWQTDSAGTGFRNIYNNGLYSGTDRNTLVVHKANLSNDQSFRCIIAAPFTCARISSIAALKVSPLPPYELIYLDGERINKRVRLRWSAAHEQHISYYHVERSRDSITFNTLDKVSATSNDQLHFYEYVDSKPWREEIYYRLNIFDATGNHHYSRTKKIIPQGLVLIIYPNPSTGKFTVETNTPYFAPATDIVVRTMLGQIIYRIRTASAITDIDLGNRLPSGCYAVQILNEAGKTIETKKLIIMPPR